MSELPAELALDFLDPGVVAERRSRIARTVLAAGRDGRLAIVGSAALPVKCARGLAAMGAKPRFLIEYDARYWGRVVDGVSVIGPSEAFAELGPRAVVIAGIWSPQHSFVETRDWLTFHGFVDILPVQAAFWAAADIIGPHYQLAEPGPLVAAFPAARQIHAALADDESRRQFAGHLQWRVTLDSVHLPAGDRRRAYFGVPFLNLGGDAVVADIGAFDGDSLRSFLLWRCGCQAFHALEPDPISFDRLRAFVASLSPEVAAHVHPAQIAAGAAADTLVMTPTGKPGSATGAHSKVQREIPCVRLSDYFAKERVSYIKLDIEGAEADALSGAWEVIERDRPILAVAIYHKPLDIVNLPREIIAHTPGYRYHLRSHDSDGIDLVFYAVPETTAEAGRS